MFFLRYDVTRSKEIGKEKNNAYKLYVPCNNNV